AMPLDETGRHAWLGRLPPEHEDLAAALHAALLPGQRQDADLKALSRLPKFDPPEKAPASSGLQAGVNVGPYELIRLLGAGGMAEVWLARRADGAFKREVALKLPTLMQLRGDLKQRFARERDILAGLEHPQIARFYDAGIDPNGLPYLAMEYVNGDPLTSWCEAHRMTLAERLALFLQVLEAVQYAHEKQIVHRDLKPSNILVTESGQVRLLDFGVAKLLEAPETEETPLTSVYGRALTPDYASPELLRGDAVDPRSDVYSLGVVLYELLAGSRPYRLKRAASMGMLGQAVDSVDVKRPSTRLVAEAVATRAGMPEQLAQQLRGDLDAIALKALAKDPIERYPSVAALLEDLQRYRAGEPVRAQPARLLYRLRKFAQRNMTVVSICALSFAAIVATVGYSLYRETVYRVRLTAHAVAVAPDTLPEKSIAVLPFVNMSSDKEQDYFSDGLTEEMIELLGQVPELRVPARTSSFYFKGKNETIANMARQLKVAHVLEGSVRKAGKQLRITAQLIRADNGYQLWSQSYDREDGDVFAVQDDIAKAVVGVLKVKLAGAAQETGSRATTNTEAYNQYLLGGQLYRRGGRENHRHASAAYGKAIALDPNYAAAYAGLALAEASFAEDTGDADGIERAERDVDKAIELAPADSDGYSARSVLRATWLWDWSGAQADIEKALILDPRNGDVQYRHARLLTAMGRLPEAIAAQKKATDLDPLSSSAWESLGRCYTAIGDYVSADAALGRAIAIEPTSVYALNNLGTLRLLQAKGEEALATFRKIDNAGFRLMGIAMAEHTLQHAKESQQALDELMAKYAQDSAYQIADVFAWRSERGRAFEWLDRAYLQRDGGLSSIKSDPSVRSLYPDPRFNALLQKMKLPE
ncbi:MAG: protein kinase domain-containing protein, partial [Terriglobales bacterium]